MARPQEFILFAVRAQLRMDEEDGRPGPQNPEIRLTGRPERRPCRIPVPRPTRRLRLRLLPLLQIATLRSPCAGQPWASALPQVQENSMKTYQGSEIRNVAVVGHAHSGKTTLIAAMLHAAKMTPTQGRVEDGSAVTAYDEEEVARGITMQNAVAFAEWQGVKINLVDTPGFHMFTHEARAALLPVESAVVVVNAQNGVEPVTERVWRYAEEANVPRIVSSTRWTTPKPAAAAA